MAVIRFRGRALNEHAQRESLVPVAKACDWRYAP